MAPLLGGPQVWGGATAKIEFGAFSLKIRYLVATILMIFLRVLPKICCGPTTRGPPGARGPRFTEPPEPFLRHW